MARSKNDIHTPNETFISENTEYPLEQKESFSAYIKEKRKAEMDSEGKEGISTKELAKRVGVEYEMFRKIVNGQKPKQSRDCIIAICAALALDVDDTNEALLRYQYFPKLDEESPRDRVIIDVLQANFDEAISVDAVNRALQNHALAVLEIVNHRGRDGRKTPADPQIISPFQILKISVKAVTLDTICDQYKSLETAYSFDRYQCIATMWLDDRAKNQTYILTTRHNDYYDVETCPWPEDPPQYPLQSYKTIEETGKFMSYFLELQGKSRSEQRRIERYLNDTRNYYVRLGAGIFNDSINVYMEKYNYEIPERNEYYLFEYIDGGYRLSVSHQSRFMQKYLTAEVYREHYGKALPSAFRSYDSLKEIEDMLSNPKFSSEDKGILKLRAIAYKEMKQDTDKCLEQLRNRQLFVRNLEYIYEDRDRVCDYYGLAEEFGCRLVGEYADIMAAGSEFADIVTENGQTVQLDISDLHRAFELGFKTVEEICHVKKATGSIEAVLR